ncbi:AraC family transcriptional regulator [Pseudomonas fluorescens]|nr:AraC family transcriptional regulator [Pseudomonas fluorescens]
MLVANTGKHFLVRTEILAGSLEVAEELEIDLTGIAQECGLKISRSANPEGYVNFNQVASFFQSVAERFDCADFGLRLASKQPPVHMGMLGHLIKLSSNLEEAIANSIQLNTFNEEALWQLKYDDRFAYLFRLDRTHYKGSLTQLHLMSVATVYKAIQAIIGKQWHPTYVSFSHASPENIKPYEQFFKSPIHFDQSFDGVVFPTSELKTRITTADPELLKIVKEYIFSTKQELFDDENTVTLVSLHIRKSLGTHECNILAIAQLMGMQLRTLQRKLKEHEVTFKQMLSDIRLEVAEQYLIKSEIRLVELSQLLGYREVSAFSRAFKNRYGVAPNHWRVQQTRSSSPS